MANQSRILDEQVQRLTRGLGNLLLPILHKIMPYLNAILMVITEIINALALLVGYDPSEYDYFGEIDESVIDLSTGLGTATENAKALKQQLRSFDKLNVITTPTDTGANTGAGGINPKILEMFNKASDDYMNSLMDVEMKATRIRDRIMEWLGFTKQVDAETGKVSFKFDHITGGTVLGALAVGGFIYSGVKNIFGILKKIGLLKFTKLTELGKIFKSKTASNSFLSSLLSLRTFAGIGGAIASLANSYSVIYELTGGAKEASKAYEELSLSILGAVSSGALLGSNFGAWGIVIGGAIGLIGGLTSAISGYIAKTNEIEVANRVFDEQGVSISVLTSYYEDFFENSTKYIGVVEDLSTKYTDSKNAMDNARASIDSFNESLSLQDGEITNSQLDELTSKYEALKKETENTHIASDNYYIALIKKSGEAKGQTELDIASQITAYKELSSTIAGYDQEYIDKEKELTKKKYEGKLSTEEYNTAIQKLKIEYGLTTNAVANLTNYAGYFKDALDESINYKDLDTLKTKVDEVKTKYDDTIKKLEDYKKQVENTNKTANEDYQKRIENLELYGDKSKATLDKIQNYKNLIAKNNSLSQEEIQKTNNTITEIQGSYKGYLSGIYTDLVQQGADTSKEFSGTISTIKGDLESLKDVDMSGFGKEFFDKVLDSVESSPNKKTTLDKIGKSFSDYGIKTSESFANAYIQDQKTGRWRRDLETASKDTGKYTNRGYLKGLKESMASKQSTDGNGGALLGEKAIEGAKDKLDINSPSIEFEKIGIYTGQGFISGIKKTETELYETINNMINKLEKKFEKVSLSINISTSVESSFNSILYKLELFTSKFRTGINKLLANMTTAMNNVRVGSDNKLYYTSMPYINVPRFKQGLDYVPKDYYLAYLDEGERVLTKQQNKEYTSSLQNGNNNKTIVSPTIIVQVGDEVVARKVLNNLEDIAKDNGKPITIGGY